MKKIKITYWASTWMVGLLMTYSAYAYLTQPEMEQAFLHLGYPAYFRIELAVAKLTGVVLLLLPVFPRIKEWIYAGFTIVFISAFISHTVAGDPVVARLSPIIFLALLIVSYLTYHKLHNEEQRRFGKNIVLYPGPENIIS